MTTSERDQLARQLAYYDQALALAIEIAEDPDDDRYEAARVFIPVLEEWMAAWDQDRSAKASGNGIRSR